MRWPLLITVPDLVDIALVSAIIFVLLAGWRRIRIRAVARVLLALAILYISAQSLGLRLTIHLMHATAVVAALVFAIAYNAEIRRAIERVLTQLTRRIVQPRRSAADQPSAALPDWASAIRAATAEMASAHIGALMVVRGRDPIDRHLTGGTPLDAIVSEPILLSIFDPNSIGHDGALVIDRGRAVGFQHHLPLSEDHPQLERRGTRHAAALGLAERCDAMCIVVSEERGTVSIARDGRLRKLDSPADLGDELVDFLRGHDPERVVRPQTGTWARSLAAARPALASLALATFLWILLVHESAIEYRSFVVPIQVTGLEPGRTVTAIEPAEVKVILAGPRRAFYFTRNSSVGMRVPAFDLESGEHELILTASEVDRPANLAFANIFPRQIRVRVD